MATIVILDDDTFNPTIASWNVNSLKARLDHVIEWLKIHKPLAVTFQEVRCDECKIDKTAFWAVGYEFVCNSRGGRNGVAIAYRDIPSKIKLVNVQRNFPNQPTFEGQLEERVIAITLQVSGQEFTLYSIYVPNGRTLDDPHFIYKLDFLDKLSEDVKGRKNVVLTGDFNVAPRDRDVWSVQNFRGCTHVTPEERVRIRNLGLRDVIPEYGLEKGEKVMSPFTYWGYIGGLFWKDMGMRIDLILTNWDCVESSYVDRDSRRLPKCSDHTPLIGKLTLPQ